MFALSEFSLEALFTGWRGQVKLFQCSGVEQRAESYDGPDRGRIIPQPQEESLENLGRSRSAEKYVHIVLAI